MSKADMRAEKLAEKGVVARGRSNLDERLAAEYLGVSVHSLRRWRVYGGGPRFLKMGARCLYPIAELEAYQASCLRRSTSDPGPTQKTLPAAQQPTKVTRICKGKVNPPAGLSHGQGLGGAEQ